MKVALVTGVSRRAGIGFAIARRLTEAGVKVFAHHHVAHDAERAWGADPAGIEAVIAQLGGETAHAGFDLARPDAPAQLIDAARAAFGHVDILVCNHASSGPDGALEDVTAEMLDAHWAVNTRASLLLAQAFAAQHDGREGGRIVLLTSGQGQGPMPGAIAYATSKGALAAITLSLADGLADRGITVNCVNPGPTDTGWATPGLLDAVTEHMPAGRWGEPDDAARLIAFLVSDDGRWITGQTIHSEGGFRRGE
ncbi:SDR family oxidoreductase [Solirubrobacter deserti]|uniref:SDR family oxidoreductase n=1 Tax=Solirubrobacter deserti TaxID=2282478 RepID=A0ABT4RS35_9ACTN|nr:SDR family oxidoreductase [Solirubrobacter deserti]MDA0141402.1 SDR family oxidoreductase [Solirubrobacter deserti]